MTAPWAVAVALASAGFSRADRITLAGESQLSGTVQSIDAQGVVELRSPLSPDPVMLHGEAVRSVTFSDEIEAEAIPSGRVELSNGDLIPAEIESLDDQFLRVDSPVAGKLAIPRTALKSLVLGIHPSRVIYAGPKSKEEFRSDGNHGDNWQFEDDTLRIEGQGRISKRLEVPDQFIVKFTMTWHNNPSFQFFFAEPQGLLPTVDRYYFQFTAAGIEIKRESTKGKRITSFVTLNRTPDHYPDNELKVEIRVDRSNSLLYLFLNDEPEGRFKDPVADNPTTGGGIALVSNSGNETEFQVKNIELLEWDHNGDRHRTEVRGDVKMDALIGSRGERFGGQLIAIKPSDKGPKFIFKSGFQEAPMELLESEVSTIFLQQPKAEEQDAFHSFSLKLRGNGVLRLSACSFSSDHIEVVHPLLGKLTLSRDGVTALERLDEKGAKP